MTRREFRVRGLAEPISHYTDAVRYGDLLFISGVAPMGGVVKLVGICRDAISGGVRLSDQAARSIG